MGRSLEYVKLKSNCLEMPTKTKHMARKASLSDSAPLAKQIKKEPKATVSTEEARIILDVDKVEQATKALGRIPKKPMKDKSVSDDDHDSTNALEVKLSKASTVNTKFSEFSNNIRLGGEFGCTRNGDSGSAYGDG